ncbi:MAG: hypothetical protein ACE5EQ_11715 [Phycisphaerae bacterium]
MRHLLTYFVIVLLKSTASSRAGVVIDHPGILSGGPAADTEFINPIGQQAWQRLADNILLSGNSALIRQVTWLGFYGGSGTPATPPPVTETMRIRFYGARAVDGLPDDGNILFEQSLLNPSRVATGRTVAVGGLPLEYLFEATLSTSVLLEADTQYWLEIVQIGDIDSLFRWEFAFVDESGQAFVNQNFPDWQFFAPGDLAFQLSTIPEPSTGLFVIIGLVILHRRKRKE